MQTPRIEISLDKIAHNTKRIIDFYRRKGIEVVAVTKAVCGNPDVVKCMVNSGIKILADSRIDNIIRMREADIDAEYLLLRSPFLSQAERVIKYADISLNSSIVVIKRLSKYAVDLDKHHKIIVMIELGDLREGIMPNDINETVEQILDLKKIQLVGIGVNLACYGGIKPDENNMSELSRLATAIEERFGITLPIISGGNSANYEWANNTENIGRINNLRIGESILLGTETLLREPIPSLHTDAFILKAEVIEVTNKPSVPYGTVCQNAFGKTPTFEDIGNINRVILGLGEQDVTISGLTPIDNVEILGSSSDHIILNPKALNLNVGDEVSFSLDYSALLSAMTSPYISKVTSSRMTAHEYCEYVEQKYRKTVHELCNMEIIDDESPLVSLHDAGFNLIFEASIMENYKYKIREALIEKVGRISHYLDKQGKKLYIRSAWRSVVHQRLLWENRVNLLKKLNPEKSAEEIEEEISYFIAPPNNSMHSTGGAIDALIFDVKEDRIMDFGTNKGDKITLNDQCYPFHPNISEEAKINRKLLIDLFEEEDFVVDMKEYWHFDYGNRAWAVEKEKRHAIFGKILE